MAAPSLTVFYTGQGAVNGDQLNTFLQTCDNLAQARAFSGTAGSQIYIRNLDASVTGGLGPFYWNASSVTTDDNGFTTIQPSGQAGAGRWVRLAYDTPLKTGGYTVAGLPTPATVGMFAYVTDGTAALAFGATVTGGGATPYLVWNNGTNWTVFGK